MKFLVAVIAVAFMATASQAQQRQCLPRADALKLLNERFGERLEGLGIANSRVLAEIFVNPQTGSWSFVVSGADGMTCLIASGDNWVSESGDLPPNL